MKKTLATILVCLVVASCATKPTNVVAAPSVPAARIYDSGLLTPGDDRVELLVVRDEGMMGGGCITAIYLNGKVVAAIDRGEKAVLHVPLGRHVLGTGPNPEGTGLCKLGAERHRRETEIIAERGVPLRYRLALSANGEISISRTAF